MNEVGPGYLAHIIGQAEGKSAQEVGREIRQAARRQLGYQAAVDAPRMTADDLDPLPLPADRAPPTTIPPLDDPPGRAGEAARWLATGSRVVNRWPSIGAVLVLPALLSGKAWSVNGDGLNLFLVLVGPSASGKEWLWTGLRTMVSQAGGDPSRVAGVKAASARGIAEMLMEDPCIGIPLPEFGRWLGSASNPRGNPGDRSVADALLSLYSASGVYGAWAGDARSGKVTREIRSPVVTVVGETTQTALWSAMGDEMAGTGLLSRFLLVGEDSAGADILWPDFQAMPHDLRQAVDALSRPDPLDRKDVQWAPSAIEEHARQFEAWSLEKQSATEAVRLLVSRSRQTAPRLAAALALWDDAQEPVIQREHIAWAWAACHRSTAMICAAFKSGEVDTVESTGTDILLEMANEIAVDRHFSQTTLQGRARMRGWFRRQPDFVKAFHACLESLERAELIAAAPRGEAGRRGLPRGKVWVLA